MRHRIRVVALAGLLVLAGCGAGPGAHASAAAGPSTAATVRPGDDWTTYHGGAARTGYLPAGPDPRTPAARRRRSGAGRDAGRLAVRLDAQTGAVQLRAHLADPVPASALPCGNIDPVGITGTPVFDPPTGEVYAVATQAGVTHVLRAVDAATGQVRRQGGVDPPGSTPPTQLQRAALLLSGGMVYAGYGGNDGDCGQYSGGSSVRRPPEPDRRSTSRSPPARAASGCRPDPVRCRVATCSSPLATAGRPGRVGPE